MLTCVALHFFVCFFVLFFFLIILGHSSLGASNFDFRSVSVFSVRTRSSDFSEDLCAKGD